MTACIRGCLGRGHLDHCQNPDCGGCRPRPAPHPQLVCRTCEDQTRTAVRELPDLWDQVLDAATFRARTTGSSSGGRPIPLDPDGAAWRDRCKALLVGWALTLAEPRERGGRDLTLPEDTVPRLAHHLAVHTGWLLTQDTHADQLVADLLGFTDHANPDEPVHHEGTWTEGRRLAYRSRGATITIRCQCGGRVPIDLDEGAILRCRACDEWGTLDWWRTREIGDDPAPMTLRDLTEWLLVTHGLDIPDRRLRDWADTGVITPVEAAATLGVGRPARRFDPVTVAAIALNPPGRRTA